MDSARWDRVQSLFHDAAERPAAERRGWLEDSCADDSTLVAEVLALLDEDARTSLLDKDVAAVARDVVLPRPSLSLDPEQFHPYRLRRPLGEGGMGVVYLAERPDLGSLVAIKILRDGWLSPARRQRFHSEQRTLAQLNHPGIAHLYDAHTLADGTPWFVMEYVDGVPFTEHCTTRRSSVVDRLTLFRAVCGAVQYAHDHGVIHRDLKPSNILVKSDGTVRLLDFGIAKHLDPLEASGAGARTTMRLMTPAYASPEQVLGEQAGVQSDVYSLGVILYELLTGELPFDAAVVNAPEAGLTTREPVKPSIKAGAKSSGVGTASWSDLDVLCLTAMRRDPARRYQSVEALIRDIDHFQKDEPLEARPDTWRYTAAKFVRRNWKAMSAMAAVVAGVAVMLGMSLNRGDRPISANTLQRNPEAYDLFLRSAGGRYDPGPKNVEQIQMLERAVALDPGLVAAGGRLAILHTERGELASAYREAWDLVRRRPDSPDAHFALSYTLRFAGLMQDASRECSTAMSLDPHNWGWRSCVVVSLALGDHEAAKGYVELDMGSEWAKALMIHTLVHESKPDEALKLGKPNLPQWKSYDVLLACLAGRPDADIRALVAAVPIDTDPETNYYAAAHLSYCGQTEASLRLLKTAIQDGYCSYPTMDSDPFFARLRMAPEYAAVRSAGMACQNAFLEERRRIG